MQQAIGEDVAAIRVGAHLNFVDGGEIKGPVGGHAFDGGEEIARVGRDDFFFAGDQGDLVDALFCDGAVVIFPRQ